MSIADKITSIEGHLTADYEGLENLGCDLTNVNKNIQNIRTCLDSIYSNIPKTTGEGSNLSLSTLKGRINVDDIKGDTTQEGTPTPSSPQDINVVTGTQELVVQNKNLCDEQFRQGSRFTTGLEDTTRLFTTQNYPIKSGQAYTLSTTLNTSTFKYAINLCTIPYPIITSQGSSQFYDSGWKTSSSFTFTPAQDGYLGIVIAKSNGTDSLTPSDISSYTFQIELGSTATSYVEHQEQTKTLHLGDIELCKIGTYQDRIFESSGKQLFDKSNSSQILNAFLNGSGKTIQSNSNARTLYIPIKPSTTYTISKILSARFILGTFESYEIGSTTTNMITATTSESAEITSRSNDNYLCVFYYLSTADTLSEETIRNSIMINEGSTALPYEPYGSDKWYIEKNIGKVLLKDVPRGTNNWIKSNAYSTNEYFCGFCGFASIKINSYYILCNKLINAIYTDTTTSECIANDSESINLKIKASRLSENSPTGLANYLANEGSDIYILYILKTPTYEEITNETLLNELNELEKMMSYNGQTNISISGNLPMILNVSALKGE